MKTGGTELILPLDEEDYGRQARNMAISGTVTINMASTIISGELPRWVTVYSNQHILENIYQSLDNNDWKPEAKDTGNGNLSLSCQLSPNTVMELGIGPGRPWGFRLKKGNEPGADEFCKEEMIEWLDAFHDYMNKHAYYEGQVDKKGGRGTLSRWKGSVWETSYEAGAKSVRLGGKSKSLR